MAFFVPNSNQRIRVTASSTVGEGQDTILVSWGRRAIVNVDVCCSTVEVGGLM